MSEIANSIGVSAPIAPFDSTDSYPTHFAKYGKGGYFSVNTKTDLDNYPAERLEPGSLAYVEVDDTFYIRKVNNGALEWVEIDIFNTVPEVDLSSLDIRPPGDISPQELPDFLERIDRGSKYIIYVDPNHANATDVKTNKGNSPLRPFKTIERACLEAARKSFKAGGDPDSPNDFTEKVSIYLAPATYYVNNGVGGVSEDSEYNARQDASNLIFVNKRWLISEAYEAANIDNYIDNLSLSDEEKEELKTACRRDLDIYISSIANDIAIGGNLEVIRSANAIKPNGVYISAYDNIEERTTTVAALENIKSNIRNFVLNNTAESVGGVNIDSIILEGNNDGTNRCIQIKDAADTLIDILINTLDDPLYSVPPLADANRGTYELSFPDTGEPTENNLQGFNSAYQAGIILPRGISIVGADLRKVVIRPKYVPNSDGSEGKSAIFRMTGANFFSGFTVKDQEGLERSHHNLSCFEFCDEASLNAYYDNVAKIFKDNKQFNLLFDSSNLIFFNSFWINRRISEFFVPAEDENYKNAILNDLDRIIYALSADLRNQTDQRFKALSTELADKLTADFTTGRPDEAAKYNPVINELYSLLVEAISNRAVVPEGGYIDLSVPLDETSPTNPCVEVQNIIFTFLEILRDSLAGEPITDAFDVNDAYSITDVEVVDSENEIVGPLSSQSANTVDGASPYIFSASLRSVYGMNGIDGDGSVVSGFKSYLAAQFTVISIQKDTNAFVASNGAGEVGNKRYKGTRFNDYIGTDPIGDWRNFGYRVTNGAYSQLVSCFCIGPAVHYWADSGAEFSITNSTSNFGDVSIQAYGFVGQDSTGGAYSQDQNYTLLAVKPPKPISTAATDAKTFTIGGFQSRTNNSLTLKNPVDFANLNPYTLKGGSQIYLRKLNTGDDAVLEPFTEISAVINPSFNPDTSADIITIPISSFSSDWPAIGSNDETVLDGASVYIKRIVDIRSREDRVHKLIVEAPLESRGKPIENFIFRIDIDSGNNQNEFPGQSFSQFNYDVDNVFYVAKSEVYGQEQNRQYEITLLGAYINNEGEIDSNVLYYPELDLDFDPVTQSNLIVTNPTDSKTYIAISEVLSHLQESASLLNLNSQPNNLARQILVEFNKPTTVRCGGQTWEYLGYYNYDTAIPALQSSQIGSGLTLDQKISFVLNKLQNQKYGGRIYATGIDEEGNFYVGTRVFNVRTGEESDLRFGDSEESDTKSYIKVNISESLKMLSGSELSIASAAIFESGSSLDIREDGVKANLRVDPITATEISRMGFARPATLEEISLESERNSGATPGQAFVTPQALASWRQSRQLVSLRTGITRVYIAQSSDDFGFTPSGWYGGYTQRYWPEPPFPLVVNSRNPGLEFRPFNSFSAAAAWCNTVLTSTETVELIVAPGRYNMSATFNCNVILNGARGQGSYGSPNDPNESVILCRYLSIFFSRNEDGFVIPGGINLGSERLDIRGPGESSISRVFFENPIDTYRHRYGLAETESPLEHQLRLVLNRQYRQIYSSTPLSDYPIEQDSNENPYYFIRFYNPSSCIIKRSGSLSLTNVIFYPQGVTASSTTSGVELEDACRSAYGYDTWYKRLGSLIELVNCSLTINGSAIRGVGLYTLPKTINLAADNASDNNRSYVIANTAAPSAPWWVKYSYHSDESGNYDADQSTVGYVTLFGTSHSFLKTYGQVNIRFCTSGFRQNDKITPFYNYNDDRNNIRLERYHNDTVNFSQINQFDPTLLGSRGTISIPNNDGANLVTEFRTTRGPMFNALCYVASRDANLDFGGYSDTFTASDYAGFKGAFSYIPILEDNSLSITGTSLRVAGLGFNSRYRLSKGDIWAETSYSGGQVWALAGRTAFDFVHSNTLNIYSIRLNGGSYNSRGDVGSPGEVTAENSFLDFSGDLVVYQQEDGVPSDPTLNYDTATPPNVTAITDRDPRDHNGNVAIGFGNIGPTAGTVDPTREFNSRLTVFNLTISRNIII